MDEFDRYSELFAENGDFDIPANVAAGIAIQATPKLKVAVDYQRIFYSDVDAVGNEGPIPSPQGPAADGSWSQPSQYWFWVGRHQYCPTRLAL